MRLIKKLFLYRMKMFAENIFENRLEYSGTDLDSKQYEEFRFDLRNDYELIAVQGYCENCKSQQNIAVSYLELKKGGASDDTRVDCPTCKLDDSVLIPKFYY